MMKSTQTSGTVALDTPVAHRETPVRLFLSPPHMSGNEIQFVQDAFESNYIAPLGPQVDAFEREFCEVTGVKYAVALSSGTAAIHTALRLLGVAHGDEVFASTLTFFGSVTPVTFQGATPVFIDCDRHSWNMDPDLLEKELTRCANQGKIPKAVVPTDLYGQCVDLARILDICDGYGVPVVCDCAEALGARYRLQSEHSSQFTAEWHHAGTGAKAAVYSFNGNKIITTSGGGMLVSEDEKFIEKARFLSQQARDPAPYYKHSEIGYNYGMSNVLAAVGRGQLRVLDERVARKRQIFDYYESAMGDLPGLEFMPEASYSRCTRWLTVVLIAPDLFGVDREAVRLALEAENIESRPVWMPMHLQPVFDIGDQGQVNRERAGIIESRQGKGKGGYPARIVGGAVSEDLFEYGLCLPSGTAMSEGDLERVVGVIRGMHRS
jgi:dTDP-4-amino-4,6-dideoxygalactose transaminase